MSRYRVGLEIIERLRAKSNLPSLAKAGRPVAYLQVGEEIGLGTADMNKIELEVLNVDQNGDVHEGELLA